MRLIDGDKLFEFLSNQPVKEVGAFSKGVNKGLNIARSAIRNVDVVKPIDPETLPIVQELRAELARVMAGCEISEGSAFLNSKRKDN